jgi:Zn-dependent peptidase ImmA (M78 family)
VLYTDTFVYSIIVSEIMAPFSLVHETKHSLLHPEHDVYVNKHSGCYDIQSLEFLTNIF